MLYRLGADFVVAVHFAFVLFAVLGGFLVLRWRRWAWVHIAAVLWAALIEFADWMCPLTFLEDWFRERGGDTMPSSDFVGHYVLPVLYPDQMTRQLQIALGLLVLVLNAAIYAWLLRRRWNARH